FGRTPASQGDECRLISDANIMGKVEGDPTLLRSVQSGDLVHLEAL
ncbi:MAG: cyclophilin-like family protein, partial [Candidatus Thiodiazotropha sp.]